MNQISPLFKLHSCFKVDVNSSQPVCHSSDLFLSLRCPTKILCISYLLVTPYTSYSVNPHVVSFCSLLLISLRTNLCSQALSLHCHLSACDVNQSSLQIMHCISFHTARLYCVLWDLLSIRP
jgi:hypothetical protein